MLEQFEAGTKPFDPDKLEKLIVVEGGGAELPANARRTLVTTENARASCHATWSEKVLPLYKEMQYPITEGMESRFVGWTSRMFAGSVVDARTPIFPGLDYSDYLRQLKGATWESSVSNPRLNPEDRVTLSEVEADQAENVGPKSCFLDWRRDGPSKVKAVFSDKVWSSDLDEAALGRAVAYCVHEMLSGPPIHMLPLDEAIKGMGGDPKYALDPTKNAGVPYLNRNWANFASRSGEAREYGESSYRYYIQKARQWIDQAIQANGWNQLCRDVYAMASQRTVSKGLNPFGSRKVKRFVCAMPKDDVICQKTIIPVLQRRMSMRRNAAGVRYIPAWQPLPVLDKSMQVLLSAASSSKSIVNSGDISNFDASVPPALLWMIVMEMAKYMDGPTSRLWLSVSYSNIYRCGCLTPTDVYEPTTGSVKSGENETQILGTLTNMVINRYGHEIGLYNLKAWCGMGDDFVGFGDGYIPDTIEQCFRHFNMEANAGKQFYKKGYLHFLQKLHIEGLPGGIGSVARVGGSILTVEDDTQLRYDERNKYAYELQALARAENANFSPYFNEFVDFLKTGDRYRLGSDMSPKEILTGAGDYANRKILEANIKTWSPVGMGVPFAQWSVNRVARGEKAPPLGSDRFKFVYGRSYDSVAI